MNDEQKRALDEAIEDDFLLWLGSLSEDGFEELMREEETEKTAAPTSRASVPIKGLSDGFSLCADDLERRA